MGILKTLLRVNRSNARGSKPPFETFAVGKTSTGIWFPKKITSEKRLGLYGVNPVTQKPEKTLPLGEIGNAMLSIAAACKWCATNVDGLSFDQKRTLLGYARELPEAVQKSEWPKNGLATTESSSRPTNVAN